MSSAKTISGILTPLMVPLCANGEMNEGELRRYIDWLIDKGVHGLYPNGSTGEFTRFTAEERRRIIQIVCDQTADRVPVLAGAAEANVRETLDACNAYRDFGARAVAIVSPFYYKLSPESVFAYYREIALKSPIDVTLYNIPLFASPIDLETVCRLAEFDRIIGIKDSSGDLAGMTRMIQSVRPLRPEFLFMTGWDAALVPMLMAGCQGGIHATSGIVPEITRAIFDLTKKSRFDEALSLQKKLLELFDTTFCAGDFPEGFRSAISLRGFNFGKGRQPLTEKQSAMLTTATKKIKLIIQQMLDNPVLAQILNNFISHLSLEVATYMKTNGFLGIDIGTQGLSVIFTDTELKILASGEGDYDMVSELDSECYEQQPYDWENALKEAMTALREKTSSMQIDMDVLAIGISGQMHGEVLTSKDGEPVGPARLWCDGRNEAEGNELTERLGTKCPKRMTAVRWLWTIRNQPEKAAHVSHMTTPAGWIAYRLTGCWNLGIGDAAGMFPIDQQSLTYNTQMLADFDAIATQSVKKSSSSSTLPKLSDLLPSVKKAGEDGGSLDAHGAQLLGLPEGIPVAPAEGDQPAALAGSLIATPGQVSMSFGTSVVANSVGDRAFEGISISIDHFCAPDGRPINMVWLRNGTTAMNMAVNLFGGDFSTIMPQVLAAEADCGGLLALPFMDDEPGLGVSQGGTAMVIGLNNETATPGNAVKAMLLATIFNLRLGSKQLDEQGYPRTEIILSGGLVKTPELGQLVADAFNTPVTIFDGGDEGTAWGAALMAKFRSESLAGRATDWKQFLETQKTGTPTRFTPHNESVAILNGVFERYQKLVHTHGQLEPVVNQ